MGHFAACRYTVITRDTVVEEFAHLTACAWTFNGLTIPMASSGCMQAWANDARGTATLDRSKHLQESSSGWKVMLLQSLQPLYK